MPERIEFEMHPQLLRHVFREQAGTHAKAWYEIFMNGVDAGATEIVANMTTTGFTSDDNGTGIQTREEIMRNWKMVGAPQDELEKARKTFGKFRMGRGQVFDKGKNMWRTGPFKLEVDLNSDEGAFNLTKMKKAKKGCRIEVKYFEKLTNVEVSDSIKEIKRLVKWLGVNNVTITLNDEVITQDPRDQKKGFWTHETDRLFLKIGGTGGMSVYHMGGHIRDYHGHTFGVSGELVSKVPMQVNFARNDIMDKCPVWKEAKTLVKKKADKVIKKSARMDDDKRQRLADRILESDLPAPEARAAKLFTDVCGRHWSMDQLRNLYGYGEKYSVAEQGSVIGDKIHKMKLAFVFSQGTMDRFSLQDGKELVECLQEWDEHGHGEFSYGWTYQPMADLEAGFDQTYKILAADEYEPYENIAVSLCERLGSWFTRELNTDRRRIIVGMSGTANAWTDGSSYIAFNRDWLKYRDLGTVQGCCELGGLLLHEYCHDDNDMETHTHDVEFYQRFHDAREALAAFTHEAVGCVPDYIRTEGKKLTRKQLRQQDALVKAAEATDGLDKIAASN